MSDLKIFTENIDYKALQQIFTLVKQDSFANSKIRIMPDVHAGAGCVIGFTATGAVSAKKDEILLIPINMRDGSLLCKGKGNEDWNCSAPHGAGRILSRSEAKEVISLDEFEKSMDGIYTTTVSKSTIDESPMAYKPMEEIIGCIADTVEIMKILKPIYNYKAAE